jgi:hypothetical protein
VSRLRRLSVVVFMALAASCGSSPPDPVTTFVATLNKAAYGWGGRIRTFNLLIQTLRQLASRAVHAVVTSPSAPESAIARCMARWFHASGMQPPAIFIAATLKSAIVSSRPLVKSHRVGNWPSSNQTPLASTAAK